MTILQVLYTLFIIGLIVFEAVQLVKCIRLHKKLKAIKKKKEEIING